MRLLWGIVTAFAVGTAIASPAHVFGKKAKSPIPIEYGFDKVLMFTLDEHNDLVKGVVAEDDGSPISPYQALGLMEGGYRPPPYWNRTGECCKPTEKCHAYVGWMMDMQSQNAWENPEQKAEANSHIECCMRQYKASCKDPMDGNKIVWRDPRKACSPTKDQALKKELENKEKEEQQENDADEQDQRNDENDQEHEEVDEGMHP